MISNTRRIAGNAVFMLTSDVVNKATTFLLYTVVAHHLGTLEFGQISLSLTLFSVFQVFAGLGLKPLITREVAKDKMKTDQYLVNGSVLVVVSSLLSILAVLMFVLFINYSPDTASIILLLSLGLLPYSLSTICEAVLQAWEQMHYIAYANMLANIMKVGLIFLVLSWGYGLYQLIILILACYIAIAGVEWWLVLRYITKPRLNINPSFAFAIIRATSIFLGMDGVIAIAGSLNFILLSKFVNEKDVGLYNAATQLMAPMILISNSIVFSVFPVMCRKFDTSLQSLKQITEYLIELLLAIALPIAVGLFFLSDLMLLLLYGRPEFVLASAALRIMVWNLILAALTTILGPVLVASHREKITLRIVTIDAVASLVFGLIFISQFGLIGAAIAAVFVRIVDVFQHYIPASRLLSKIGLTRLIWRPVLASTCMAVYLSMVRNQNFFLTVLSAGALYIGVLLTLTIWANGGLRQLKAKYLYMWSE